MSDEAKRSALRALLTRAADCEAARQRAVKDGDQVKVAAFEAELRELWRQHGERGARQG